MYFSAAEIHNLHCSRVLCLLRVTCDESFSLELEVTYVQILSPSQLKLSDGEIKSNSKQPKNATILARVVVCVAVVKITVFKSTVRQVAFDEPEVIRINGYQHDWTRHHTARKRDLRRACCSKMKSLDVRVCHATSA